MDERAKEIIKEVVNSLEKSINEYVNENNKEECSYLSMSKALLNIKLNATMVVSAMKQILSSK